MAPMPGRSLRHLVDEVGSMPEWLRWTLLVLLCTYSLASLYARINLRFGRKMYRRANRYRLRRDPLHILRYTILPLAITYAYVRALFALE